MYRKTKTYGKNSLPIFKFWLKKNYPSKTSIITSLFQIHTWWSLFRYLFWNCCCSSFEDFKADDLIQFRTKTRIFIKSTLYSSYIDVLSVRFYWKNSNLLAYVFSSTSSRPEVFCEKAVLRNLLKFTGKHLCQGFFFNKVPGLGLQL